MSDIQRIKNEIDLLPLSDIDLYMSKIKNNTNDRFSDVKMAYCLIKKQCLDEAWIYVQRIKKAFTKNELGTFKCFFDREDKSLDDNIVYGYRVYKGCDGDYHIQEEGGSSSGNNNNNNGDGGWCECCGYCCISYLCFGILSQDACWGWHWIVSPESAKNFWCGDSWCRNFWCDSPCWRC